jgi:hypothetical protein
VERGRLGGGYGVNQNIPEIFDWVSERAKCTPFKVFERLRLQVREDMDKRNLLPAETGVLLRKFSFQEDGNWFAVVYCPYGTNQGIRFSINENGVVVKDIESRNVLHEGILTISDDGGCRLKVGGTEYNLWQFRKLALHELFFVNREIVP